MNAECGIANVEYRISTATAKERSNSSRDRQEVVQTPFCIHNSAFSIRRRRKGRFPTHRPALELFNAFTLNPRGRAPTTRLVSSAQGLLPYAECLVPSC
jgi:hypothetical protein